MHEDPDVIAAQGTPGGERLTKALEASRAEAAALRTRLGDNGGKGSGPNKKQRGNGWGMDGGKGGGKGGKGHGGKGGGGWQGNGGWQGGWQGGHGGGYGGYGGQPGYGNFMPPMGMPPNAGYPPQTMAQVFPQYAGGGPPPAPPLQHAGPRPGPPVPRCGDWMKGNCYRGQQCKFAHF